MPFIPEDFGQATLVFTIPGPGGPAMVTFGFADNEAASPDTIADTIQIAWTGTGSLMEMMDTSASLVQTNVLIRRGGALVPGIDLTQVAGTQGANAASPQVAALIQKQTGFAGRNRRGRMYLPAVLDPGETGTYINPALSNMQSAATTFLGNLATASLPMQLLHVNPADTPNPVTALVVQSLAATQRRRIR